MNDAGHNAGPIDAVITWVDGADPAHAARLAAYLDSIGAGRPNAAHPTRFNDAGEIDYCVASIFRFAPWIRTLHVVTDRQAPRLIGQLAGTRFADRVRVVDHAELFAGHAQHLPTFNSRAIITTLWRIDGLSERFVYFNDDFALIRPVRPDDFFRDERVVLRGKWQRQSAHRPLRKLIAAARRMAGKDPARSPTARVRNLAAQEASARMAGFDRDYLRLYHNPFPMRRSTLEHFFAERPDLLEANLRHRLRSPAQFKTEVLAAHLEAAQGNAVFDARLHAVQLKPSEQWFPRMRRRMANADRDENAAFVCVQSLELAPPRVQASIRDWLDRRIGRLAEVLAHATMREAGAVAGSGLEDLRGDI